MCRLDIGTKKVLIRFASNYRQNTTRYLIDILVNARGDRVDRCCELRLMVVGTQP